MRLIIYIILTLLYVGLVVGGIICEISWFTMIWLIYGVVYFGSKMMKLLEERGL